MTAAREPPTARGLQAIVDRLWQSGAGADDRVWLSELLADPSRDPANLDAALRDELAVFAALIDLMSGGATVPPALRDGSTRARALAAAAAVWASARSRDPVALDRALGDLENHLRGFADHGADAVAVRGWADLALAEAALAAADRGLARRRLEDVARGGAPAPLRIAANLRIVTLEMARVEVGQARIRCRRAVALAERAGRTMQAHQARLVGALLDHAAGDRGAAERALRGEAAHGPLGLLPRILLAGLKEPGQALPVFAEGLADAAARGDGFAYAMCAVAGARRYAMLGRDADALLTLTAVLHQLHPLWPTFGDIVEDERNALRAAWGAQRYASAELAAIAMLDDGSAWNRS